MSSIIDYVNSNIPDIEAGATINEGPFIDGLRTMLSEGQYTTQQLQVLFKALEGLGVDFEIAYQPATISLPQITQMVNSNIGGKKSKSMGEALGQVVGTTVSAISQSIMVPTIKSVTRTPNSGGGSSYRSPSGGGHGSNAGGGSGGAAGHRSGRAGRPDGPHRTARRAACPELRSLAGTPGAARRLAGGQAEGQGPRTADAGHRRG